MKAKAFLVVLFTIVVGGVAANAQSILQANFHLSSETRWDQAVLPAGDYSLTIDSTRWPIRMFVRATNGDTAVMVIPKASTDAAPGGRYLFITGSGADRVVRSINLPDLGRSILFKPLTKRERESLYAKVSQAVPVEVAKR